jgi:hypothetical protein
MIPQHHWVSKLLGFNFSVEYKLGRTNVVANALFRRGTEQGVMHTLSYANFDIMATIRKAKISDLALVALKDQITAGMLGEPWALTDGLVTFWRRVYLPPSSPLLSTLIVDTHDDGHEGF